MRIFAAIGGAVPSLLDPALHGDGQAGVQHLLQAVESGGGAVEGLVLTLRHLDGSAFTGRVDCVRLQAGDRTR